MEVAHHSKTTIEIGGQEQLLRRQVIDDRATILQDSSSLIGRRQVVATSSGEARGRDTRKTARACA